MLRCRQLREASWTCRRRARSFDSVARLGQICVLYILQDRPVSFHAPLVHEPGHDDFFPTGMWHLSPEESSVQGTAVLAGNVHPLGVLNSPLVVRFDGGRVT